jgi:hypothetical protein
VAAKQAKSVSRLAILANLVWLVAAGCGRVPAGSDDVDVSPATLTRRAEDAPTHSAASEATSESAVLPTAGVSLPTDDPRQQGWEIESFSEAAGTQLKHLNELLRPAESVTATASRLAAQDFRCSGLRPAQLESAYDGSWLTIRRSAGGLNEVDSAQAGPARLAQVVQGLIGGVDHVRQWRSKEKIVGVSLSGSTATTDVVFQLYAEHDEGTLQVNATWECTWTAADTDLPLLTKIELRDYEEVVSTAGRQPLFQDCTTAVLDGPAFRDQLRWGVDHWLTRVETRHGIDIGGWQGLAIGDVNGDGLDDVYLVQPGGLPNRLYIQNPDGTATERAAEAGVDWLDSCHAALLVDLDNDLDQDLLLATSNGVLIMSNDGRGNFQVKAAKVTPAAYPYSLAAADYDVDGDLDVYVCCYNPRLGINRHVLFARPVPYHDANNGGPNVLLRNDATPSNGSWRFSYATDRVGLYENKRRFSYAAAWADHDNDGDLDLYVANDFGRNNLYGNQGGRFHDGAAQANVEDIGPGMSCCWGDYNRDGWLDLYVSNMFSSAGNRISEQAQFQQVADPQTRAAFRRHARGNTLYLNRQDGTFSDVSIEAGVVLGRWAWGSLFGDLNNDGWEDLLVANGFLTQADPVDL